MYRLQRSAANWRLKGDQNNAYFHAMASARKRRNLIESVLVDGSDVCDHNSKARAFHSFFCSLMGAASPDSGLLENLEWSMLYPTSGTFPVNLAEPISDQEIRRTISDWPSNKSPGPDGYTGEFYKFFLEEMIPDISQTLNNALSSGSLSPLNSSYIALVPKVEAPTETTDFRPVSIIHSMQRILSKILASRFTPHIDQLITLSQSGFIPGRNIIENFLYAQQVIQFANKEKIQIGVFKADLHKAFDTLNWDFIQKVLLAIGLPPLFIAWIMNCILQGNSRVIVNGIAGRKINLKRGVRQGDPFSPYLFIVAFDFFSRWLKSLARSGALSLPFPQMQPALFYADDSVIFFKPCTEQVRFLKMILLALQFISGLALNRNKSDLMVTHLDEELVIALSQEMGCRPSKFPIRYLGLPLSDKKLKKQSYLPLIAKLKSKLNSWKAPFLSSAGRLVLINSCITSMPLYFMSAFQVPKWVLKEIDTIRMNFFWQGNSMDRRRLIMVPWDTICTPKKQGGLGVINLRDMNTALLAKHLWNWMSSRDNLCSQLVATLQNNRTTLVPIFSPLQKEFQSIAPMLVPLITAISGDGKNILFWHHNWGLGTLKYRYEDLYSFAFNPNLTLSRFVADWHNNATIFRNTLHGSRSASAQWHSLQQSLSHNLTLPLTTNRDSFRWNLNSDGMFSVNSIYNFFKKFPKHSSCLLHLWKLKIPPRMKVFVWQMSLNKIVTVDNLKKRGWQQASFCTLCASDEETAKHLFNSCKLFNEVLQKASDYSPLFTNFDFTSNPQFLADSTKPLIHREIMGILCFILWRERCNRIFSESSQSVAALAEQIFSEWEALRR
ncbi:hypothetical protein LUZ63_003689 [Rhynchospora breviuscula]|uniref:Reverse transcriptase domain-containing protein n=1 Tax=Rhynchospora breviuscula TaxID=2022672 RepID=A0A9Q0D1T6_9POAL|nr:hypothetical protein LUZ63_003689 [Rhynchospora breviuscula]